MSKPYDDEPMPAYYSQGVSLMGCVAGNIQDARGEPVVIVTIGRLVGGIEPLSFKLPDARKLVVDLLIALATNEDEFAESLLDDRFPSDDDGRYHYPVED